MDRPSDGQAETVSAAPRDATTDRPKNSQDRSIEKIVNSESFRAWETRLAVIAARDAERRQRAREVTAKDWPSRPSPDRDAGLTRSYGTHNVVRGRVA